MGAPSGNEFWKLRSKHGRDKIFATPELLWDACNEYFEITSKRVWEKTEYKGNPPEKVLIPTSVPFTLSGLYIFLDVNTGFFHDFEKTCSKDFSEIISKVRNIIYTQKLEGATVGSFNPTIVSRDLGLKDASTIEIKKVGKDLEGETYE